MVIGQVVPIGVGTGIFFFVESEVFQSAVVPDRRLKNLGYVFLGKLREVKPSYIRHMGPNPKRNPRKGRNGHANKGRPFSAIELSDSLSGRLRISFGSYLRR